MKSTTVVLFTFLLLPQISSSQEINCENMDELVSLNERAWNENKGALLHPYIAADFEYYEGSDLRATGPDQFDKVIDQVHATMKNFKVKTLQVSCSETNITSVYRVTGFHNQFQIDVDLMGISMNTITEGKISKSIDVHDILPSLLGAGYQIVPGKLGGK